MGSERSSSESSIEEDKSSNVNEYKAPKGYKLKEFDESSSVDWSSLANDDDYEIVCLRVPENIKTKHLKGMKLDLNSNDNKLGTVNIKGSHLAVHSQSSSNANESTSKFQSASINDEMDQLKLLLPTKEGQLVVADKPIVHRLQLSNSIPTLKAPKFEKHSSSDGAIKREQPTDKLKWRFRPPGFDTHGPEGLINVSTPQTKPKKDKKDKKEKKDKKRKSIDESPIKEEKKKKHKRSDSSQT